MVADRPLGARPGGARGFPGIPRGSDSWRPLLLRSPACSSRGFEGTMDPLKEKLEVVRLTPYKKNCDARSVGVLWMPYPVQSQPTLGAAW